MAGIKHREITTYLKGIQVEEVRTIPFSSWVHPWARKRMILLRTKKVGNQLKVWRIK